MSRKNMPVGSKKPAPGPRRRPRQVGTGAELRRLRRAVGVYEAALRWIIESARDRHVLQSRRGRGSGSEWIKNWTAGQVGAYDDMARVVVLALRQFHPDERSPSAYVDARERVPAPSMRVRRLLGLERWG